MINGTSDNSPMMKNNFSKQIASRIVPTGNSSPYRRQDKRVYYQEEHMEHLDPLDDDGEVKKEIAL